MASRGTHSNGNGNGNGNSALLQKWAPIALAGLALIGAASSYFGQQGQNTTTIEGLKTASQAQTERLNRMQQAISALQITQADNCQQFAKVETQFGTVETVLNKSGAEAQRHVDVMNFKLFGIPPSGIYYDVKIPHEVMPCVH